MTDEAALLEIVGQLYEAAGDAALFSKLPSLIAAEFDTDSAMIHTSAPQSLEMPAVLAITENFDSWAQSSYVEHYHYVNTWYRRGIMKPIGSVIFGQELVDETELQRIEWYDYCQKLRAFHVLGATMQVADGIVGAIGLHRPRTASRFDEGDRRKMQLILPHLQRTVQLQQRLSTLSLESAVAYDVIDGLAIGIIFVEMDGRLVFANRIAERALRTGEGLTVTQGRLCPRDPRQAHAFARLMAEAAQTSAGRSLKAGGVIPIQTAAGASLPVLVTPFRSASVGCGHNRPTAIVIFSDPAGTAAISQEVLRMAFGFTWAEARLVAGLIGGQSLTEYATAAGISINTAKTQLRDVFHKTGHTRQVDLVRAIAADPVMKLTGR